ncbi:UDP-N-acetylglucosamine--N-acetylmuramyl-(pentapeptide) pyrophosphoryl-undecaprenol N-acetylglucosamine transferase, partial [Fischerella thermalis WC542]
DHQTYNAQVFTSVGAALMFQQKELTVEKLQTEVLRLLQSPQELKAMGEKAKTIAPADSAEKLAQLVREIVEK